MATTTINDFLVAWKNFWDDDSGLSGIDGPYSDQAPPDATPTFPYAVVVATSTLDGMDTISARYRVLLDLSIYDKTKALAAGHMATVKGVFTCETGGLPTMASGKGTVLHARVGSDVPSQEDGRQVFRHRCTWEYMWEMPRT